MPASAPSRFDWLNLLVVSGPFVSPPVIDRIFPQGLDALDTDHAAKLRLAREDWAEVQLGPNPDPVVHDQWIRLVLTETLGFKPEIFAEGSAMPADLTLEVPEHATTVRPDAVVVESRGAEDSWRPRLLIHIYPLRQDLESSIEGSPWAASPAIRMTHLCRETGVRLGLVTNGERWMLVDAPNGETSAYVSWYASLWAQEPDTLRAFRSLLHARRFFGVEEGDTLERMLAESGSYQADVTEQLGAQVRRAIEVLVQSLDRADADTGRQLLADVGEGELYEAAITVMMRLVFLFFAEENGLLLLGDELYDQYYSASMLRGLLREEADRVGVEVLERRQDAWSRLLAMFRAIFAGVDHEALHLPAYGGSLFDPDRFPFLEGRHRGTTWQESEAAPLPIDNRTVLHLLDALQLLQTRERGRPSEARKLSFRALDIEQIGHVYESLLDHIAVRASGPQLGLVGPRGAEPEVSLADLDDRRRRGNVALVDYLTEQTKKSKQTVTRALTRQPDQQTLERFRVACRDDEQLLARVLPYHGLIREDPWGEPIVIRPGSIFVTAGADRRGTGTYYTPRVLTEEIVTHALEPLVYSGPAEGKPRNEWELKGPKELLELKICDFAMGSGAFLVQACRWLGERMVEAWGLAGADKSPATAEGRPPTGRLSEAIVPTDPDERLTLARRLVADRCLYGVDVNPLAVEMAKLSMWLVTLAKGRPFSFLDHALRCGDSLLGVHELEQIQAFHTDPERGDDLHATLFDPRRHLEAAVQQALQLRRQLEAFPVLDIIDAQRKAELNREAQTATDLVRLLGDLLSGAVLSVAERSEDALSTSLQRFGVEVSSVLGDDSPGGENRLRAEAARMLNMGKPPNKPQRRPFHWPIEFPEVFESPRRGFDALVSNPPFMGGVDLAARLGNDYAVHLKRAVPESRGFVDLAVYFHRRAVALVRETGMAGLLGPQSLTTTSNRRAGTDSILATGHTIRWARSRIPWPGTASIVVCAIGYSPGESLGPVELNGITVGRINSALEPVADLSSVRRLPAWLQYSEGTHLYGMAFVKREAEWIPFIQAEPALVAFLRPYVNADILCSSPTFRTDLLAVDFGNRDRDQLVGLERIVSHLEERVGQERSNQTRQIHEHRPWLFWDKRILSYAAARRLERVMACPNLSKHVPMVFVDPELLLAKTVKILITDEFAIFGLLQSSLFLSWVVATSPMRGQSVAFSTRDSLDTFVPPEDAERLRGAGRTVWEARHAAMTARRQGITDLLNLVHDPGEAASDASELRRLQETLDHAVASAYGWDDLDLDHGFQDTPQGVRYTIAPVPRVEVLDRLLKLNHERYRAGTAASLHPKSRLGRRARG